MRILLAYSGGLDTSYLVARLARVEGHDVVAATVDCGGFDAEARLEIAERAVDSGATEHRWIDARDHLFDRVLRWLIAGNVRRGGAYPLSVGAERGLQAECLAKLAVEEGFDALAHGCTAAGNDQVRFEAALAILAPELEVLAPVRDEAPSRAEQIEWLGQQGLPTPPSGGAFSINAGLWGLTIGGGPLLGSQDPLPEEAWVWTSGQPSIRRLFIDFQDGIPTAIDGNGGTPVELIELLNESLGAAGFGRGYHLGDTVLGIKGRIGYEAPAAEALILAHRELEKLVLTEEQRATKDPLGDLYGRRLHQGLFHDPLLRDLEALFASSQGRCTGRVTLQIQGGSALVEGIESPYSLLDQSDALYGEVPSATQDRRSAAWFARILAEPARLWHRAGRTAVLDHTLDPRGTPTPANQNAKVVSP